MTHDAHIGIYFWAVLLLCGGVMYAMTPTSVSIASFFRGTDNAGRAASQWMLTAVTLLYAVKGGLRSSIITDVLQSAVFILFLGIVLFYVLRLWLGKHEAAPA
ncbi:MAG: hypothetical protein ABI728_08235 [Betaproteobacteria bacterium]